MDLSALQICVLHRVYTLWPPIASGIHGTSDDGLCPPSWRQETIAVVISLQSMLSTSA